MAFFAVNTSAFLTFDNFAAIVSQNAAVIIVTAACAMLLMRLRRFISRLADGSCRRCRGSGVPKSECSSRYFQCPGSRIHLGINGRRSHRNLRVIADRGYSWWLGRSAWNCSGSRPKAVYGFPEFVVELGSGKFLGLAYIGWISLAIAAAGVIVMSTTPFGKHILAIGVNKRASFLVGNPREENDSVSLYPDRLGRRRRRNPDNRSPGPVRPPAHWALAWRSPF